jgi:paraquat-inducible protein B
MTKAETENRTRPHWEEPEVRRRRVSLIWALPVVAALVAAWLGYTAFAEKGPTITISFKTASGLEPGKTRIKHHDVELGVVDRVDPSPDLSNVVVSAKMNKTAAEHLREGTKFWVVRPRISITSFSGLETLVSGAYIEMDPGAGKSTHAFQGLEEPPVVRADVPGTEYLLTTDKLGSIGPGSPISFRGIDVGEVASYQFEGLESGIVIRVFVRKPYDALVRKDTRFWNASGVSLSTGASGFKVEVDSLQAVLAGGIAFETPESVQKAQPAAEGETFPLYDGRSAAQEASFTRRSRALLEFDGSVRGLEAGAPVDFRGMTIGRVAEIHLVVDAARRTAKIPVVVEIDLDRIGIINQPPEELGSNKLAEQLVALGLRAQLRPASLITGQLFVALDFFPDAPPAKIEMTDTYPKLPTVESDFENMTRSVNQALDKIVSLPLGDLLQDLRKLVGSAQTIVASPEVAESLHSLNATLISTQQLLGDLQTQSGPLIASLRRVSDSAEATVKRTDTVIASMNAGYGRDSQVRADLADLLKQLQETAKSARYLTNYLEQHPEAVLRGKAGAK